MDSNENDKEKKNYSNYKFLNSDEINNLEFIYNKLQNNKNDIVSIQSLQRFLISNHNMDICNDLLDFFHVNGSTISLDFFLNALNCDMNSFKSKEKMKSLFEILDTNKKGFITYKNFVQSAKEFENEFDKETLKKIFNIIDLNNNDKILYEDFKNSISNI